MLVEYGDSDVIEYRWKFFGGEKEDEKGILSTFTFTYEGGFKRGMMEGRGTKVFIENHEKFRRAEGNFEGGELVQGSVTYFNGDLYEG